MSKMIKILTVVCFTLLFCLSCTEYTPKPRGYFRIEPETARYRMVAEEKLPYLFNVSQLAAVEFPAMGEEAKGITLSYPALGAKVYCSYLSVTPATLGIVENECRSLVARQAQKVASISEKTYSNPEKRVYGLFFQLEGESASPLQFMLTDSVSNFFRGALYYDCKPNADSLAPVTQYLREDILELIESFSWKK